MTRTSIIHILLLYLLIAPTSAADKVLVRTELKPDTVWVGQQATLTMTVLGLNGWAQIPDLSTIEIPGCYVIPMGDNRTRVQETINGNGYTGQQYTLKVYPQRSGVIEIPSFILQAELKTWGYNAKAEQHTLQTESQSFHAQLPKGADPSLPLIVTTDFSVAQEWEPEQSDFTVAKHSSVPCA